MKNLLFSVLITITFKFTLNAQNTEKVKGNRNIIVKKTDINPFHTIVVDEDFKVDIIYNKTTSVEIETDENLHDYLLFKVTDSVLTFNKIARITSKKRLKITVAYNEDLSNIEIKDDGEIHSLATMKLTKGNLKTSGNSSAGLTIYTDDFYFESLDKSKVELNLTCDNTKLILNGNSKLKALINAPKINADLYQRTNATIEGVTDTAKIRTDNNSSFMGKNLTTKSAIVQADMSSDITLEMIDSITIEASGSSSVNIYGDPEIEVLKLTDTSKIQKKVK